MQKLKTTAQLITRFSLGIGYLLPVLDRFGLRGSPGTKGVNWGSWSKFIDYTNFILPIFNRGLSNFTGIVVTAAEITLAFGLILGIRTRHMAIGSAVLTACFGLCMAIFVGLNSPFSYPVFVFTGASLLLATLDGYQWTWDEYGKD